MSATRRSVLGSAAGLAFAGFARLADAEEAPASLTRDQVESDAYRSEVAGYGPLKRDPAGLFDLPEGFSYTVVSKAGDPMSDSLITPCKMDGMGCFAAGPDQVALVRNHEIKGTDLDITAFGPGKSLAAKFPADKVYDLTDDGLPHGGGTTTLIYDIKSRQLVSSHLSLAGTVTNCAGGRTPWGSWLSCEETTQGKGVEAQKDHGWVFEAPSSAKAPVDPIPIKAMGPFRHEAAAVDPRTGVVYLTEDMGDGFGLFYRYLPNDRTKLLAGSRRWRCPKAPTPIPATGRRPIGSRATGAASAGSIWTASTIPTRTCATAATPAGRPGSRAAKASISATANSSSPAPAAGRRAAARSCATSPAPTRASRARRMRRAGCSSSANRATSPSWRCATTSRSRPGAT